MRPFCQLSATTHTGIGARAGIYNENVHNPVNKKSDEKKKRDGGKPNPNTVVNARHYFDSET